MPDIGDTVTGHFTKISNGKIKRIEWVGVVCGRNTDGKKGRRTSDLLVKIDGIGEPQWVMRSKVKRSK